MQLFKAVILAALILTGPSSVYAQSGQLRAGDTYIISRDANLVFRGSHKLYNRMSEGLIEVKYCNRSYWVRYATVAWTQLETDQGYDVQVELNRGKGWRPICNHPQEQVNLKGLGVSEDPRVVVQQDGATIDRVNRFAAIRQSFRSDAEASEDDDN